MPAVPRGAAEGLSHRRGEGLTTIALTFDDGPGEATRPILDLLYDAGSHATFFVLGNHVRGNEPLLQRMRDEGHEIGLHGWDHTPIDELTEAELLGQIMLTRAAVKNACGGRVRWWRSPWGRQPDWAIDVLLKERLGVVGIGIDALDCDRDAATILATVREQMTNDSIVCLHDGVAPNGKSETPTRAETVKAVAALLEEVKSVTVSRLPDHG